MKKYNNKFKDIFLIKNKFIKDSRGYFLKFDKNSNYKNAQQCFSFNKKKFTLRGLHFQNKPFQEIKVITCLKGSIFDVVVNVNKKSSNYLKWKSFKLNDKNKYSLYVGKDYAHGFMTLEDNSIISYQIIGKYISKKQNGLLWNDQRIKIKWPYMPKIISSRDKKFKKKY
jgi:dTDP-4-dehydrorhamnose 3,5-epimerase